jgi:glyoxylase-like metal-dependent hydrolase (beta-lactamase superfamily II)
MAESSDSPVYLRQIQVGPMENFVYLLGDRTAGKCVLVDPAWEVDKVVDLAEADGMEVVGGLVTHWHPDHTNQVEQLLERTKSKLHVHKAEKTILDRLAGRTDVVAHEGGDVLEVGDLKIRFVHTPGHTPGSQCFLLELPEEERALVSGDTLFIGACGRTDFPGGSPEEMYRSLSELAKLPDGTVLLPGHNYADRPISTIKDERETNPMMLFPSVDAFVAAHQARRR